MFVANALEQTGFCIPLRDPFQSHLLPLLEPQTGASPFFVSAAFPVDMSGNPCRNGAACTRPDCWFQHPPGRSVSSKSGGGGGGGGQTVCRFGRSCHRDGCFYAHPEGRDYDGSAAPIGAISAGPGAQHAPGRQPSPPQDEFDADEFEGGPSLEEQEAAALAALEQCECCGGRPYECSTPACAAQGRCFCTMGGADPDNEEADDSWRDEWFPASKDCPCCAGSIYRCQQQKDDCVSGQCYCSLTKA